MHCVFCENPVVKARTILENEFAWIFPSFYPIVPVHLLVCPKRCVSTYEELRTEEREAMFALMTQIKPVLKHRYQAVGFNYAWNEGGTAGQTVPHVHIHFVPRRENDKQDLGYDPKDAFYRADTQHSLSENELQIIKEELQAVLNLPATNTIERTS